MIAYEQGEESVLESKPKFRKVPRAVCLRLMMPLLVVVVSGPVQAGMVPGEGRVARNSEVLQLWEEASGGSAPALERSREGGTRLRWRGALSTDFYGSRSSGSKIMTPVGNRDGNYSVQVQTEGRAHWSAANQSWFMFSGNASNDRAVLNHPAMIGTLQMGHQGENYRVSLGDVAVNLSTLGASAGLRGLQGEGHIGRTLIQAVAGVQSDTWEALAQRERRSMYLRDGWAVKLQQGVNDSLAVFLTTQGFSDDADTRIAAMTGLAAAKGNASTAGFSLQHQRFSLNGEAGTSTLKESGHNDEDDHAWVVDGGWQGNRIGVQLGHHDLGAYYSTLSGAALAGVRETYGSANWTTNDWLSFNGDVRHTLNRRAGALPSLPPGSPPGTPNAYKSDSWTLGSNVAILPVPGLNLQLQHTASDGSNAGGGGNDADDSTLNLQYGAQGWTAALGLQRYDVENSALSATNAVTRGWNLLLGRQWGEAAAGAWNAGFQVFYSDQRQSLDAGGRTRNSNYQLSMNAQHQRWGRFALVWYDGRVRDTATGQDLDQRQLQVEAQRSLGRIGSLKLYFRNNNSFSGNTLIAYEEKVFGLQFLSTFGAGSLDP